MEALIDRRWLKTSTAQTLAYKSSQIMMAALIRLADRVRAEPLLAPPAATGTAATGSDEINKWTLRYGRLRYGAPAPGGLVVVDTIVDTAPIIVNGGTWEQRVQCMWPDFTRNIATASSKGCVQVPPRLSQYDGPPLECARAVYDGFITHSQVDVLSEAAADVLRQNRDESSSKGAYVTLALHTFHDDASLREMLGDAATEVLQDATLRIQDMFENSFSPGFRPALSGALITELRADEVDLDAPNVHDQYSAFHVDRANLASYDYSALLYLDTQGEGFDGSDLEFVDLTQDEDVMSRTVVKPSAGRLVLFTGGHENLHGVTRIKRGARRVVAMWFACDEGDSMRDVLGGLLSSKGDSSNRGESGAAGSSSEEDVVPFVASLV